MVWSLFFVVGLGVVVGLLVLIVIYMEFNFYEFGMFVLLYMNGVFFLFVSFLVGVFIVLVVMN